MATPALTPELIEKIKPYRYDRIIEKHEGPERWEDVFTYQDPIVLELGGYPVLLPIDREHAPNLTLLRTIVGDGGTALTLFLRDTTYGTDWYDSGYLAVCERLPGEDLYLATVYHEWFIFENPREMKHAPEATDRDGDN